MAINGYFFNAVQSGGVYDRVYNAEDVTSYLNKIVGNGVFPNPSNQLQVRAGTGMQVIVKAGEGWINGHKLINTADMQISVDGPDALLNRIDRVIFYADVSTRSMGIMIKKGTNATNPTAPALVRNTTRYEMSLATVRVNKQITGIAQSMITDTRADSSVCGWVAGLIQQVDTSQLFVQWQTAYSNYYNQSTAAFDSWKNTQETNFETWETEQTTDFESWEASRQAQFEAWLQTLTQQLQIGTYIKQYEKTTTLIPQAAVDVSLNMTGYTYENSDVFFVFINGILAQEAVNYTINAGSSTPYITFYFDDVNEQSPTVQIKVLKSVIGISTT